MELFLIRRNEWRYMWTDLNSPRESALIIEWPPTPHVQLIKFDQCLSGMLLFKEVCNHLADDGDGH